MAPDDGFFIDLDTYTRPPDDACPRKEWERPRRRKSASQLELERHKRDETRIHDVFGGYDLENLFAVSINFDFVSSNLKSAITTARKRLKNFFDRWKRRDRFNGSAYGRFEISPQGIMHWHGIVSDTVRDADRIAGRLRNTFRGPRQVHVKQITEPDGGLDGWRWYLGKGSLWRNNQERIRKLLVGVGSRTMSFGWGIQKRDDNGLNDGSTVMASDDNGADVGDRDNGGGGGSERKRVTGPPPAGPRSTSYPTTASPAFSIL
jgi:hypothetical protein